MLSKYTFPESGRAIEIERVSFTTLSLLRAYYEKNYPDKPELPVVVVNKGTIDESTEENPKDPKYLEARRVWEQKKNRAVWLASQLLYAKHLKAHPENLEIQGALDDAQQFGVDLRVQVLDEYAQAGVPFDVQHMDKFLYLWCVCVTTSSESSLFSNFMTMGSGPTQDLVEQAMYSFRSQVPNVANN